MTSKHEVNVHKSNFGELPFYGIYTDVFVTSRPSTERQLNKLTSIYDLDVFNLNIRSNSNINPDQNVMNNHIHCKYYSPENFTKIKKGNHRLSNNHFSLFHNNVSSLIRKNLEHLQVQIFDELKFTLSVLV